MHVVILSFFSCSRPNHPGILGKAVAPSRLNLKYAQPQSEQPMMNSPDATFEGIGPVLVWTYASAGAVVA